MCREIKEIEELFETLENITINNEYVNQIVTKTKNKAITKLKEVHLSDVIGGFEPSDEEIIEIMKAYYDSKQDHAMNYIDAKEVCGKYFFVRTVINNHKSQK